jgi:hypothetical protein
MRMKTGLKDLMIRASLEKRGGSVESNKIQPMEGIPRMSLILAAVTLDLAGALLEGRSARPLQLMKEDGAKGVPFGVCWMLSIGRSHLGPESRSTIPVLGDSGIRIYYPRPPWRPAVVLGCRPPQAPEGAGLGQM